MDTEQVYRDWVEARSFGCKACGYTSTNRRVVEQHLRLNHSDLFDGQTSPPAPPPPSVSEQEHTAGAGAAGMSVASGGRTPATVAAADSKRVGTAAAAAMRESVPVGPVTFYTDAGTWENGTPRQRSVLAVWDSRTGGIVVHEDLPGTTNNEAEYAAIIAALEVARAERVAAPQFRSDSQLCVNQINGRWQVKEERLRPLRERAARLLKEVGGRIEWVPRERNHAGIFLEKTYKK